MVRYYARQREHTRKRILLRWVGTRLWSACVFGSLYLGVAEKLLYHRKKGGGGA